MVEPTHLKNMLVKLGSSSPIFGMKITIWVATTHLEALTNKYTSQKNQRYYTSTSAHESSRSHPYRFKIKKLEVQTLEESFLTTLPRKLTDHDLMSFFLRFGYGFLAARKCVRRFLFGWGYSGGRWKEMMLEKIVRFASYTLIFFCYWKTMIAWKQTNRCLKWVCKHFGSFFYTVFGFVYREGSCFRLSCLVLSSAWLPCSGCSVRTGFRKWP